ncbi:phenylalanine 4-monooxygenase [Breoghania sp. L-A4]|uniref:phenylalanine 4-monooxygenase n=1 Tax=Breoghania sp. L-A4 TaxID=2304600 RepID=UPI000E359825|nr:phenylalanine 4-monooxygenase [Breoghania sp. L-A4]AXS41638.1 phenylalanine 4-monooxygenase [Breoghania sp. L-A4]
MAKSSAYTAKAPQPDGRIVYTEEENLVWRDLYARQEANVRRWSAPEYNVGFDRLALPADRVPQCTDVSRTLTALTGWKVEPVPALIGFSKFFGMLANRTFPAASFIRSRKDFDYIKEPDIFHEIFGHTPLLTDERFARFSEMIGKAGERLEARDYSWLIRLYWFTIEFGLTHANGGYKALGSGLASSPTELPYSVESPDAQRRAFDVIDILRTPYRIDIHQPVYFVLDKVDDLFKAAERDLAADIRTAQSRGLFAPLYPVKEDA